MSLTDTSKQVKSGIKIFIGLVVLYYFVVYAVIPFGSNTFKAIFPEKDPPTPLYGKLDSLKFVSYLDTRAIEPNYKLDTIDGVLPSDFPTKMVVYKFIPKVPSFDKGKNAIDTALKFGYTENDLITSLKEETYRFRKLDTTSLLEINTNTGKLNQITSLLGRASNYPTGKLNQNTAISLAERFFKDIGLLDDPLYETGFKNVRFGLITRNSIVKTNTSNTANIARVDFYRSIGKYPILGPDPKDGMIYIFLRLPEKENPIYNYPIAEGILHRVETQSNATYPIISVEQAWEKVRNNQGVIVNVTARTNESLLDSNISRIEEIFIDNIYLAYYETHEFQEFLQPIYVFEGKFTSTGTQGGTIAIYYPAITAEYINSPAPNQDSQE